MAITDHPLSCGYSNYSGGYGFFDDMQQAINEGEWLRGVFWKPAKLAEICERALKPLLLVFKRFDFRSAPRWRSQRWKAKT